MAVVKLASGKMAKVGTTTKIGGKDYTVMADGSVRSGGKTTAPATQKMPSKPAAKPAKAPVKAAKKAEAPVPASRSQMMKARGTGGDGPTIGNVDLGRKPYVPPKNPPKDTQPGRNGRRVPIIPGLGNS